MSSGYKSALGMWRTALVVSALYINLIQCLLTFAAGVYMWQTDAEAYNINIPTLVLLGGGQLAAGLAIVAYFALRPGRKNKTGA